MLVSKTNPAALALYEKNGFERRGETFMYDIDFYCYQIDFSIIKTSRLLIRHFRPDDWQDLYEYLSQAEVVEYEPYEPFTVKFAKLEAINRSKNHDFFAVCLKDSLKLIGNIYLTEREYNSWELGYVFKSKYWRSGYAEEAARALVSQVFRDKSAHRVCAMCNPQNTPSWKLLERLGFRREGHLRQNVFFRKDEFGCPVWQDTYEYGVLASEWK